MTQNQFPEAPTLYRLIGSHPSFALNILATHPYPAHPHPPIYLVTHGGAGTTTFSKGAIRRKVVYRFHAKN